MIESYLPILLSALINLLQPYQQDEIGLSISFLLSLIYFVRLLFFQHISLIVTLFDCSNVNTRISVIIKGEGFAGRIKVYHIFLTYIEFKILTKAT